MSVKIALNASLGVLAISLLAMPVQAAGKSKKGEKKIECNVNVEDGDVRITKTVNGKTVKTDEDDKDCAVVINDSMSWGGSNGFFLKKLDGGDGEIKIITMEGDDGPRHGFFNKGGRGKKRIVVKMDDDRGGLHEWSGDMDFDMMRFGPDMPAHPRMPFAMGNSFQFMFMDDDNKDLDLDKDGTVTEAEAKKARDAKLKAYDSNRDGMLSLEEYQAYWVSRLHAQMVDAFQDLDEDGDARVTAEEFAAPAVKRAEMNARILKMLENHHDEKEDRKNRKKKRK